MLFPFLISLLISHPSLASAAQSASHISPKVSDRHVQQPAAKPALKGRFLHLTDLHPDPYYRAGTSEDEACHLHKRKKKKNKKHGRRGGGKISKEGNRGENSWEDEEENDEVELNEELSGSIGSLRTKKDKPRKAGYWGLPISDCDTPISLINATFDWLAENFRDEVDFVIWTGDNVRHDIDTHLPRSLPEILDLNAYILDRMRSTFGKHTTLVPSIGNNDIYPHNVMFPGPSKITNSYLSLWSSLIPEHHAHTFARGGYYSVSPPHLKDSLLLISLNTIYFFEHNTAVDGCPPFDDDLSILASAPWGPSSNSSTLPSPSSPEAAAGFSAFLAALKLRRDIDPGTEHLLWLEQQLVLSRAKRMQVWMSGHVPASRTNWYESCWSKYSELMGEYGDVVVGQLFGHMNVDHFSFIMPKDARSLGSPSSHLPAPPSLAQHPLLSATSGTLRRQLPLSAHSSISSTTDPADNVEIDSLPDDLFSLYSSLPRPPETANLDGFAVTHVNPSIIPTYLPGVRVWEYNVSWPLESSNEQAPTRPAGGRRGWWRSWSQKKPHKEERFANAPSRKNTFLTPLAYSQYYLPESALALANSLAASPLSLSSSNTSTRPTLPPPPKWELEYTTLSASTVASRLLHPPSFPDPLLLPTTLPPQLTTLLSHPRSANKLFALRRLLQNKLWELTPYSGVMREGEGLTVRQWVRAAKGVVEGGREGRAWKGFRKRVGVGSGEF